MPDTPWTKLGKHDAARREADYKKSPYTEIPGWGRTQTYAPPLPAPVQVIDPLTGNPAWQMPARWLTTVTETFARLFHLGIEPPRRRPVIQYCNRCDRHVDSLADAGTLGPIAVPVPMDHVGANEYGHREGNLYQRYRVRGTILRRTAQASVSWGVSQPPIHPPMLSLETNVTWERKTIDHVEQGPYVHWVTRMKVFDCKSRIRKPSFGYRGGSVGQELVNALAKSGMTGLPLLDDDDAILKLVAFAEELPDATFSVVSVEGDTFDLDLVGAGEDAEAVVHGRVTLRGHEEGFLTVEAWHPASAHDA